MSGKIRIEDVDSINEVPSAHYVLVLGCSNPNCSLPHIVLFDRNDEPIAEFTLESVEGVDHFIGCLQDMIRTRH